MRQRSILLQLQIFIVCDSKAWRRIIAYLLFPAVTSARIGERHASACRYKNELPEGLTPLHPDAIYDPNHVPVFLKSYGVHTVHTKQDEFTFEQLVIGNSGQIAHHWMYSQLRFNFVRTTSQDIESSGTTSEWLVRSIIPHESLPAVSGDRRESREVLRPSGRAVIRRKRNTPTASDKRQK